MQLGTPLTLLTQPADDYVWAFTQEVSRGAVTVALARGEEDYTPLLIREFPRATSSTPLEGLFQYWNQPLPAHCRY